MPTSFLCLPPEVRNQIYTYVLGSKDPVDPRLWILDKVRTRRYKILGMSHIPSLNILLTNETIKQEAIYFLYAANDFALRWDIPLDDVDHKYKDFLDAIGSEKAAFIENVHFDLFNFCGPAWMQESNAVTQDPRRFELLKKVKKHCPNLKTLTVSARLTDVIRGRWRCIAGPSTPAMWQGVYQTFASELQIFPSATKIYIEAEQDAESIHDEFFQDYGWILETIRSEAANIFLKMYADGDALSEKVEKRKRELEAEWPAMALSHEAFNIALEEYGLLGELEADEPGAHDVTLMNEVLGPEWELEVSDEVQTSSHWL